MKELGLRLRFAGATPPTVAALLLFTLPLLAAPTYPVGLALMLALDVPLGLAWAWDARRAWRRLAALEAAWTAPATLIAGRPASLVLSLHNSDPEPILLVAQPAWGPGMGQAAAPLELSVPACATGDAALGVHPLEPGKYAHASLTVRAAGPLGLAWLDVESPAPSVLEVRQAVVAAPELLPSFPVPTLAEGSRPRPGRAPDGEMASIRPYQPGDSLRAVHWKSSARRGRVVVREFDAEHRDHTWIALECGRGMAATRDGLSGYRSALSAVMALSKRLVEAGGSVNVVVFDSCIRVRVDGTASRAGLGALGRALAQVEPTALEADETLLDPILAASRRKGDRVLLVSARPSRSLRRGLAERAAVWARGHRVGVAHLESGPDRVGTAASLDLFRTTLGEMESLPESHLERALAEAGIGWRAAAPGDFTAALVELAGLTAPAERGRRRAGRPA